MKILRNLLLTFPLLTISMAVYCQLMAPTEAYNNQTVQHTDNGTIFELTDGVVTTYDGNGQDLTGPMGLVIPEFTTFTVPNTSNQNTEWTTEAHPSVFQAHWMTPQVVDIFHPVFRNFL